jgi:hypothetical protein
MNNRKRKQLLILTGIFLALLALALYFTRTHPFQSGNVFSDFAVTDTANITRVVMTDREENQVALDRLSPSEWRLNRVYEANNAMVSSLLRTLYNVEVKGIVARSAHNTVIADMAANNTLVDIYQRVPRIRIGRMKLFPRVKLSKRYYVGGPTPDHHGTYMRLEGSDKAFITFVPGQNAFLSLRYSTRESDWRDHTIVALTINQISSIDVEIPGRPEESYRIAKTGERSFEVFQYYNQPVSIPLDTPRVLEFLASFRNVKYEGLINDIDPLRRDSIINSVPMQTITITAIDGGVHTIVTFRRKSPYEFDEITQQEVKWDRDRLFALINDGKDLTLCQFYVFDDLLKPFKWFRADYNPSESFYFYEE